MSYPSKTHPATERMDLYKVDQLGKVVVAATLLRGEYLVDAEPDPDIPGAYRLKEAHHKPKSDA